MGAGPQIRHLRGAAGHLGHGGGFLTNLAQGESEFERLCQQELRLRERITAFSGGDRLGRDAVHERDA